MERIFIIGGIALLTLLTLNFTRSSISQSSAEIFNEAVITCTAMGQSMVEEIQSRSFDENSVSAAIMTKGDLTAAANLGYDGSESISTAFDDIDDFNDFVRIQTLPRLGAFKLAVKVYYVPKSNPDLKSSTPTFAKRIDITIVNKFIPDTIFINKVVAY